VFLVNNQFWRIEASFDYKDNILADISILQSGKNISQYVTFKLNNIKHTFYEEQQRH